MPPSNARAHDENRPHEILPRERIQLQGSLKTTRAVDILLMIFLLRVYFMHERGAVIRERWWNTQKVSIQSSVSRW